MYNQSGDGMVNLLFIGDDNFLGRGLENKTEFLRLLYSLLQRPGHTVISVNGRGTSWDYVCNLST